jgi:UDP-N-acetylmuramoyl-L-alanyl-D-glutamate--2,6-diaminopimelate ligase
VTESTLTNGMSLSRLVGALRNADARNVRDETVIRFTNDSRQVGPGTLFVATRGVTADGHDFIEAALKMGAVAVVAERPAPIPDAPQIIVEDSTRAFAEIASEFHGNPSRDLRLFGVTGTNGKTSTSHLLRSICEVASWGKVGVIGTVGHGVEAELEKSVHTTPEPATLHRLFAEMKAKGCSGVVVEVSSHAVRQQRVWGVDFEIGMLTNVTRDHLDYHPTFADYIAAKREFCESLLSKERRKKEGVLAYSLDNEHSRDIGEAFKGRKVTASTEERADVFATGVRATLEGTRFILNVEGEKAVEVNLRLLGAFSVSNAVLAAAGARIIGIGADGIKAGLEAVARVPGRFEAIGGGSRPLVIVDYAHTPDSLERTLLFCRSLEPKRLITVFGCGGDRDRGKRPLMGEIAQRISHACYVTSDNPRTEEPARILAEILSGMDRRRPGIVVEPDRRKAIHDAIHAARAGDLVAICGKGHEDYQIIGTERHHFDDREESQRALDEWRVG